MTLSTAQKTTAGRERRGDAAGASESPRPLRRAFLAAAAVLLLGTQPARAQGTTPPDGSWKDLAEFSFVATSGNSESSTLGLSNKLWRAWGLSRFETNAKAIRAESRTEDRFAVGTPADFDVEEPDTELSAESYFLDARYDRKMTARSFWYGSAAWLRDEFAGIADRYTAAGGLGNQWVDADRRKFRTDYAVTYTDEEATVDDSPSNDSFIGARASAAWMQKFGESGVYDHVTIVDESLEETKDLRVDMTNAVAVAMTARLALKVSLQFLYDNRPAFEEIALFDTTGTQTGTVLNELDRLDTILKTSLVVKID